jgi:hypothetical protein
MITKPKKKIVKTKLKRNPGPQRYLNSKPVPTKSQELESIDDVMELPGFDIIVIWKKGTKFSSVIGQINKTGRDYIVQEPFKDKDTSSVLFQEKDIVRIYFNKSQNSIVINIE